jgi:hypothetical protein
MHYTRSLSSKHSFASDGLDNRMRVCWCDLSTSFLELWSVCQQCVECFKKLVVGTMQDDSLISGHDTSPRLTDFTLKYGVEGGERET